LNVKLAEEPVIVALEEVTTIDAGKEFKGGISVLDTKV
jgi:hypothetical protein